MIQAIIDKHFFNLLIFTLVFGILLYDAIGFDYTDEICALFLFILFSIYLFSTKGWDFNKAFLTTIGIFLFYFCYSLYIGSNTKTAILSDMLIQIKPYLAFFCVYSMMPRLNESQKRILKSLCLVLWFPLLCIGLAGAVNIKLLTLLMGHPTYFAAAVICVSFCYLYCSDFRTIDKVVFIALLSIGLISGRSKFYGFFALATIIMFYFSAMKQFKLNAKNITIILLTLVAVIFVAREKIYFYFYQTVTEQVDRDMIARYVLYATAPQILIDYFPFGSGFASYGTFSSGVYYSDIYAKYGIDGVWGMSRDHYNFIADTYYPSLAQFGVVGILLFMTFWLYLLLKAVRFHKIHANMKCLSLVIMIIGFFLIESTTDSTFTTHRGFFVLILLGLILSDMKYGQMEQSLPASKQVTHENTSNQ